MSRSKTNSQVLIRQDQPVLHGFGGGRFVDPCRPWFAMDVLLFDAEAPEPPETPETRTGF